MLHSFRCTMNYKGSKINFLWLILFKKKLKSHMSQNPKSRIIWSKTQETLCLQGMFHCLWLTPTGVCGCSGGDKIALKCGLKLWKKVFGLGLIWLSSYTYMYVVCRCWEEEGLVEHTVWIKKNYCLISRIFIIDCVG